MAIYQNKETPPDIRLLVLRVLEERGCSKSELARKIEQRDVCNKETVMRYLRGTTETSAKVLSYIFAELEITIQLPHI
tara:strand:+ start:43 stop:276 length:234 start_codon:yes stop_codon:yes gene_type:complete